MISSLKRFHEHVKPYWALILVAVFAGILRYNIPLLLPWGIKTVIDDILTMSESAERLYKLNLWMGGLLAAYLVWAVATYLRIYLAGVAGHKIIFDLRHKLYLHVQKMSLNFFEKRKIGSVVSRMIGDIAVAQNIVGQAFTNTLLDFSSVILILFIIFRLNWKLALISISIVPFYLWINRHFGRKIRATSRLVQQKVESISGDLHEKLGGISVIQSFTREKEEEMNFFEQCKIHFDYLLENVTHHAVAVSLTGFLTSAAPIFVIWYGALHVMAGDLSVGGLTAFYAYLGLLYNPINRLAELNIIIANSLAAMDRIFEVFDTHPEVKEKKGAVELDDARGRIEFQSVSFSYDATRVILTDFNLTVNVGECLALVGPSGAGKSTIAKLIPRFYDIQKGCLLIDQYDIRELTLKSLRDQIALVSQEPILFSGTISENILYGKKEAKEPEMLRAAQAANAHDFIMRLPERYETQVGERGVSLSAGEKQRIAIARAFLKGAPILILDEPTSALDPDSEALVREALGRLMQDRTTLIIAHRLSTIKHADRIVVLENGVIREMGTHEELVSRASGFYKTFHEKQILHT